MSFFSTKAGSVLRNHVWATDNYWLRLSPVRKAILRVHLYFRHVLDRNEFGRKALKIDEFIEDALIDGPRRDRYFTERTGADEDGSAPVREYGGPGLVITRKRYGYLEPSRFFHDTLRDRLMGVTAREETRSFKVTSLITIDKNVVTRKDASGHREKVFYKEQLEKFRSFFGPDAEKKPIQEGYIRFFFPLFDAGEFIRNGAEFTLDHSSLFGAGETVSVVEFFSSRLRMRNRRNPFHRAVPLLKKAAVAAFLFFYISLFLFDLAMLAYGTLRNEYYYSFPSPGQTINTRDTPYARRANRIYMRNNRARFADFNFSDGPPPRGDACRIDSREQIAVQLNYQAYRSLRMQDQNGCTIVAFDWRKMRSLARSDPRRYRELVARMINLRWWESALGAIDGLSGDRLDLFDYMSISRERVREDITAAIMKSVAPLEWVRGVNEVSDVLTVLFHKANSMKFAAIGEVPGVMREAVILREDRRFRNDLFPVPHRGNDNLVIVPQVTKKVLRKMFGGMHDLAGRYGLGWLERLCDEYEQKFNASIRNESRGGSSISNQVMEMLYTKYITSGAGDADFADLQIEQKMHELPASLAVDWFWSRDHVLEAYVNEVYGGHLYSDIRGFKSQAEMYFSRGLAGLNLREQVMLVAAIKKPSRIKEYALCLKAEELAALIREGASRAAVAGWVADNEYYRIDRANYREILGSKARAKAWIERRMNSTLRLLRENGEIGEDEYRDARHRQKVSFRFAPGVVSFDSRLANNIKRELERELGQGRSDAGMVVVATIDMPLQKRLQKMVDRGSRWVSVDPDCLVDGQPGQVRVEGGARIIHAHDGARSGVPRVLNRIIADVGGPSREDDEWDWVSLANRSLGSSLKPFLDLYFILSGYNLQDMFKNSRVTYNTYTLEQQRIYQNFIHKNPKRWKEIEEIEKYWDWSPRNFREYTNEWMSVEDALVHSVNGIHVQIQELVTPAVFARLLNETMAITDPEALHRPFRSIILGGSAGDQRYDRYLLAYSLFTNLGIIQKHTHIDAVRGPDGAVIRPAYRPMRCSVLDRFGAERVRAAVILIDMALRETVRRGTMAGMDGIGAGKTGTSNDLRDALATVHFIAGDCAYIAGVRLGNRRNYSIGRAADRIAVPLLRDILAATFKGSAILGGDEYDAYLAKLARSCGEVAFSNGHYLLKGRDGRPRRLEVVRTQEEKRGEFLVIAEKYYDDGRYDDAVRYYEEFLKLAVEFDSDHPAFERMVHACIENNNIERARQLIEHFSRPGRIWKIARIIEKKYDVTLKVNEDFYSGNEEYERKKRDRKRKKNIGERGEDGAQPENGAAVPREEDGAPAKDHAAPDSNGARPEKEKNLPEHEDAPSGEEAVPEEKTNNQPLENNNSPQ